MSTTTKSVRKIVGIAYEVSKETLPPYLHAKSKKVYTQSQLVACLVLKTYLRMDYRGASQFLSDFEEIRKVIELNEAPHFTTLQQACKRLMKQANFKILVTEILEAYEAKKIGVSLISDLRQLMALDLKVAT